MPDSPTRRRLVSCLREARPRRRARDGRGRAWRSGRPSAPAAGWREAASKLFNPRVELFLVLANESGHRGAPVRRLRWSDIDLDKRLVRWRAASDKGRWAHVTPLTDEATASLTAERARTLAIGDAWIFPHGNDPSRPLTVHAARSMWKRLATRAA